MPKTPEKNNHTHYYALMDSTEGKELDDKVEHASGVTTLDGVIDDAHSHKWFLHWDRDKNKYVVSFGPGGKTPHSHPDQLIDSLR